MNTTWVHTALAVALSAGLTTPAAATEPGDKPPVIAPGPYRITTGT